MIKILMAVFMTVTVVGCGAKEHQLSLKQNELILEYGDRLPEQLMDFVETDGDIEEIEYTSSNIDDFHSVLPVGEYSIDYKLGNQVQTMKIKVQDTTAPQLNLINKVEIFENQKFEYTDYVSIEEKSDYDMKIQDENVDYTLPGEYQVQLYVKDKYNNESYLDIPVLVKEIQLNIKQKNIALTKNKTQKLNIQTNSDSLIEYSSSNEKVAVVDENGNIKAIGKGKATISVCVDGKVKECKVVVNELTSSKNTANSTQKHHSSQNNHHNNVGSTVYITNTGHKYHRSGCRYLRKSQHSIGKNSAINQGFEACKVCRP